MIPMGVLATTCAGDAFWDLFVSSGALWAERVAILDWADSRGLRFALPYAFVIRTPRAVLFDLFLLSSCYLFICAGT